MENVEVAEFLAASDAPKQRFLVGDLVEVRMQEKGLRGSWHPAKVVEVLKGQRRVEYEELLEDDEKTKLRELIPVGRASDGDNLIGTLPLKTPPKKTRPMLRPRPPVHPASQPISWQEGVWVECLFEDAWWEGILAENITTVNVEDVAQITRKSEVDVLFPEENDVSKMSSKLMRIGQEWDEETGNWSVKGCAPVPVVGPNKKRPKKGSFQRQSNSEKQQQEAFEEVAPLLSKETKATTATNSMEPETTEAAIESELCVNPLALDIAINRLVENDEVLCDSVVSQISKGYGYEERLHMFNLGGGSPNVPLKVEGQGLVDACPAIDEPALEENEADLNATDDAVPIEQMDVQSPVGNNVSTAAQTEEAAELFLKSTGWIITKTPRKKTGEVIWKCKSPKVIGAAVKTFSSLVEAFRFEANRGPPGGTVQEFPTLSQTTFSNTKDCVNGSSASSAIGEDEDENDKYATSARQILKRSGWDVFHGLETGSNGKCAYFYRTPEAGIDSRKWFRNWRLAIEEYIKEEKIDPKQQDAVPSQKKRGGRGQDSSPLPTPRRVTRRLSLPEDAKSMPEDAKKLADGPGPSSEEVAKSVLPETLNVRDFADVDDSFKKDINIVVNSSGRKRTAVDLGRKFTRSNGTSPTSPLMNSYLEKPFGNVSTLTQNDNAYVLHVITHDVLKEQISATVENNDMLIKARYVMEERFNNLPVQCMGSMSARVTLPKNVEREKITAELKSPFLIFTLPKRHSAKRPTRD